MIARVSAGGSRRMMLLAWGVALLALHAAGAYGAEPIRGGTLRIATSQTVDTLDAATTSVTIVRTMHYHTHNQLYTYDEKYALIPDLAAGHSVSPDGKVWTFTIRKGVRFHDGSDLTADDVVASWQRYAKVSPTGPKMAKDITRVSAPDRYTVRFEFEGDAGPFLARLSTPHTGFKVYPAKIARAAADRPLRIEEMIGTGPYRFVEWRRGESLTMERFAGYVPDDRYDGPRGLGGRRTAYLDRLVWYFVSEPGAQEAGLRSGRFDLADSVPVELRGAIEAQKGLTGTVIKPYVWVNMMVNHHNPPMNDLRVRRAIQIGLDQQLVMLAAVGDPDLVRLAPGLAFEEQEWYSDAGKDVYARNDKARARALLREAGYSGAEVVLMTTKTIPYLYQTAVVIQQQLKEIGVNVRLEVMDWAALLGHITNRDLWTKWHLSSMTHTIRHDPSGWDRNFRTDQWTPYANPEMDRLLDTVSNSRDVKVRYDAFRNVQRIFHEDVVNIKHGDFFAWHAHREAVKGYQGFEGYLFWNVWLDR